MTGKRSKSAALRRRYPEYIAELDRLVQSRTITPAKAHEYADAAIPGAEWAPWRPVSETRSTAMAVRGRARQRGVARVVDMIPLGIFAATSLSAWPARKLDELIPIRPFGDRAPPSLLAVPLLIGGALLARHFDKHLLAKSLAALGLGLGAGHLGRAAVKKFTGGSQ